MKCSDCHSDNSLNYYFCKKCGFNLVNGRLFKNLRSRNKPFTLHEKAYFFWLEAGEPEKRDLEFWLKAENSQTIVNGKKVDKIPKF